MTRDPVPPYLVHLAVITLDHLEVEAHSRALEAQAQRSPLVNLQRILAALDPLQPHLVVKDLPLVARLKHFQHQIEISGSQITTLK